MTLTQDRHATTDHDAAAIAELQEIVERQRAAFLADPFPSLEERQGLLGALAVMLMSRRTQIQEAMSADFGVHPALAADLIEVLGPAGRAVYAAEHLGEWMSPESRQADPALYGSGRAFVQPQPKGVVGNIVPWNFPFDLSVGPLIEMLAAGNRVVIKPSEYTPACAELLRDMVRSTFDRDRVDVVVGGLELAQAFTRVRWDHLLYTGSPAIGREIAKAAAEQLVPVTLELGGKCPAILTEDSIDAESVKQVLGTKAVKNGQMCISVDYCLVPRGRLEEFAGLAAEYMRESMPGYCASESCTGIISSRHVERIQGLLDDAQARGCDVRPLEEAGDVDPDARQLPMSLVIDPPDDLGADAGGDLRADPADQGLRRRSTRRSITSTRASARWRSTCSQRTRPSPMTSCAARRPAARASTPPLSTARCRRCPSAASARAAPAAITASRGSASSPTSAESSSAAKAT